MARSIQRDVSRSSAFRWRSLNVSITKLRNQSERFAHNCAIARQQETGKNLAPLTAGKRHRSISPYEFISRPAPRRFTKALERLRTSVSLGELRVEVVQSTGDAKKCASHCN